MGSGRPGGFRETQRGEPGCWIPGTGVEESYMESLGLEPPLVHSQYEDLSESASLAGIHREVALTVRRPGGHRTQGGPFSHSTKPHANSPEPDILSVLKTFC